MNSQNKFMKKLFLSIFIVISIVANAQKGHEIKINLKNSKDKSFYLAYYQFDKTYIADTCKNVTNGAVVFRGKEPLEKGVYCLINQDKNFLFDFLVDDKNQYFQISTKTEAVAENLEAHNSKINASFFNYLKFFVAKNKDIQTTISSTKGMSKADSTTLVNKKIEAISKEIKEYGNSFLLKNIDTYPYDVINLKTEKTSPHEPRNRTDSLDIYKYYRKHYWDGVNFKDDATIRNPFFANKIKNYFTKIVPQIPDSICVEIDKIMSKTVSKTKTNMLLLAYFTSTYEKYPIMGFDKVFVYLADNYFKTGKAEGIYEEETILKIIERGNLLKPLLIGNPAPNLYMIDEKGQQIIAKMGFDKAKTSEELTKIYTNNLQTIQNTFVSFYSVKADYMLLVFWDIDCSHCKEEIPKIYTEYQKMLQKGKDIKVFSVYTGLKFEEFQKYVKEHKIEWINVYDGVHFNNLKEKYDVYSTPVVYVLDKNKIIKGKRLGADQIAGFIENLEKNNKKQ